jgi:hypothetical protein
LKRHADVRLAIEIGGEALHQTCDVEAGEVGGAGDTGSDLHR